MTREFSGQTVLITGASSGIGRAFALAFAALGADVVLVARRVDRLDALAAQIEREQDVKAHVAAVDLMAPETPSELQAELAQRGIAITALINNAGLGTWGEFMEEDPERLRQEIALDISAPVFLAHTFLPQILTAKRGFLINVASMAAYQPTPRMAVYGASKAFVLSFTESLWAELRNSGVKVFALSPGATSTEFNDVVGTDNATAGAAMRTPEAVVETALSHLRRKNPGPSVVDGRSNTLATLGTRFLSRKASAALMYRMTDPARREKS